MDKFGVLTVNGSTIGMKRSTDGKEEEHTIRFTGNNWPKVKTKKDKESFELKIFGDEEFQEIVSFFVQLGVEVGLCQKINLEDLFVGQCGEEGCSCNVSQTN